MDKYIPFTGSNGPPTLEEWIVTPESGTYDGRKKYPWITYDELDDALGWIISAPEAWKKNFVVHSPDPYTIEVALHSNDPNQTRSQEWESHRRILQLTRTPRGDLWAYRRHTVKCAQEVSIGSIGNCNCLPSAENWKQISFQDTPNPQAGQPQNNSQDSESENESPKIRYVGLARLNNIQLRPPDDKQEQTRISPTTGNNENSPVDEDTDPSMPELEEFKNTCCRTSEELANSPEPLSEHADDPNGRPYERPNAPERPTEHDEKLWPEESELAAKWNNASGSYEERTYCLGDSRYHHRNLARPPEAPEEVAKERPFQEVPPQGKVLKGDGTYDENENYPILDREELRSIIEWCDNLPEHQEGGRDFLIHKTDEGNIAITMIGGKTYVERPRKTDIPILELERRNTGELHEVVNSVTLSNGRYQEWLNDNDCTELEERLRQSRISSDHEERPLDTTENPEPKNPPKYISCFAMIKEDDKVPVNARTEQELEETGMEDDNDTYHGNQPVLHPDRSEDMEWDPPNMSLEEIIDQKFPVPHQTEYAPTPAFGNRRTGMLAARELFPVATYDDEYNHEFYGRGVTLVTETADGEPAYHRGDALIQMTQRDPQPGPPCPSRGRVNHMRKRLFRLNEYARPHPNDTEDNVPNKQEPPAPAEDTAEPRAPHGASPPATSESETRNQISKAELEAVIEDLMEDPIEVLKEIRVYQIERNADGLIAVTRVDVDPEQMERKPNKPSGADVSEEPSKEQKAEDEYQNPLTRLGSDPQPSDRDLVAENLVDHRHQKDCAPSPCDRMETQAPQPWCELSKEKRRQSVEPDDSRNIKTTQETHQEEFANPISSLESLSQHPSIQQQPQPPCSRQMDQQPEPTRQPREYRSLAAVHMLGPMPPPQPFQPAANVLFVGDDQIEIPPCPERPRPGLVTAAHLQQVPFPGSTPREPSFFGYGSTVVVRDEDGGTRTHQGHALIHLYTPDSRSTSSIPPPTPQPEAEALLTRLYRQPDAASHLERPWTTSRHNPTHPAPPLSQFRFNPKTPGFEPQGDHHIDDHRDQPFQVVAKDPNDPQGYACEPVGILVSICEAPESTDSHTKETCNPCTTNPNGDTAGRSSSLSKRECPEANPNMLADSKARPESPVKVGILLGTIREHHTPGVMGDEPQKDASSVSESDIPPTKRQEDQLVDKKPGTHPVPSEPADVEMDTAATDTVRPSSPPNLLYPDEDEPMDEQSNKSATDPTTNNQLTLYRPPDNHEKSTDPRNRPENMSPASLEQLQTWQRNLAEMVNRAKQGTKWTDLELHQIFGNLGLLQWWYDASKLGAEERAASWDEWKRKMCEEWKRRYPEVPSETFDIQANKLPAPATNTRPIEDTESIVSMDGSNDAEATKALVPRAPPTTPIPVWNPSSPTKPKTELPTDALALPILDPDEFKELKTQVEELDQRVTETTTGIQERLTRLSEQVFEDGIIVGDLKWRMAEIQELEDRAKATGKRGYKKGKAKVPSHRYPTRFSSEQADEVLELSKKEFGDVESKIKTLEERVEEAKTERSKLKEDLVRAEALASRIDTMSASLDSFRLAQIKINLSSMQQLNGFKARLEEVEPRLDAQQRDVNILVNRYNMIQEVVNGFILQQNVRRNPPRKVTPSVPTKMSIPNHFPTKSSPLRKITVA
jgi:hypothetical protein